MHRLKLGQGSARILRLSLMAVTMLALWSTPGRAGIAVSFANPERFTDVDLRGVSVTDEIRQHLSRLAVSTLEPGVTLRVTILDIDIAGQRELFLRGSPEIRVNRGITWPKIRLRYTLQMGRRMIERREELITNRLYQMRFTAALGSDPLRYEKAMLTDWFEQRFGARARIGRTP